MKENTIRKVKCSISLMLLILTIAGIGFFLMVSPKLIDDYWFGLSLKNWFDGNGLESVECGWEVLKSGFPVNAIFKAWVEHINIDCGRLSNLAMMFVLVLPKWVGSGIALVFWVICMYYSFKLAKLSVRNSPWLVAVAVFCWSFQIGWSQFMGSLALQYNYLLPSGLMVWYLWVVNDKDVKRFGYVLLLMAGIIVGAWHEGFTVSVMIGALAVMVCYREYRIPKYYVALSGLLIGFIFLMLCPGLTVRLGAHRGALKPPLAFFSTFVMVGHFIYFLVFFRALFLIVKKRFAQFTPLLVFAVVGGAVSVFLQIYMKEERRVGWWADVISAIALLEILRTVKWRSTNLKRTVKCTSVVVLGGLSLWHWIAVDYYTYIWSREQQKIIAALANGDRKYVFLDLKAPRQLPLICTWTPYNNMMHLGLGLGFINEYYHEYDKAKYIYVLPESLRYATSASGRAVPGNSGVRELGGNMYVDVSKIKFEHNTLDSFVNSDIRLSTGLKGEGTMWITRFVSEADGKEYFYLEPNEKNLKVLFGEIERIDNLRSCR